MSRTRRRRGAVPTSPSQRAVARRVIAHSKAERCRSDFHVVDRRRAGPGSPVAHSKGARCRSDDAADAVGLVADDVVAHSKAAR